MTLQSETKRAESAAKHSASMDASVVAAAETTSAEPAELVNGVDLLVTDRRGRQRHWAVGGQWLAAAPTPAHAPATSSDVTPGAASVPTENIHHIAIHMGSGVRKTPPVLTETLAEDSAVDAIDAEDGAQAGADTASGDPSASPIQDAADPAAPSSVAGDGNTSP